MPEPIHPLKLVSLLLQYPEADQVGAIRDLEFDEVGPVSAAQRRALTGFLEGYRDQDLDQLRQS